MALADDPDATRVQPRARLAPEVTADPDATRVQSAVRADTTSNGSGSRGRGRRAARAQVSPAAQVRGWVIEIVLVLVVALVISALARAFLFEMFTVPSDSMKNTLLRSDRIVAIEVGHYQRGSIIVFKDPGGWVTDPPAPPPGPVRKVLEKLRLMPLSQTDYLVKRLIGLPGDHVQCCDAQGQVMVNGVSLDERSYLYAENGVTVAPSEDRFDVWVPEGMLFVLGDHRNASADSRPHLCDTSTSPPGLLGFVPEANVVGPVKAIALPLGRIQSFGIPATFANVPDHPDGSPPGDPVQFSDRCPT